MKHFDDRNAYNDDQVRGFITACGLWSPEIRHQSPRYGAAMVVYPLPATKDPTGVTCKRCQKVLGKRAIAFAAT